ncbi:Hypothetical protein PBC10988_33330 [Planctomycetales bacterium 10988]|nr:Hypothetical protein PBC10988_33330 [Planctomycetales bacterium 10988]
MSQDPSSSEKPKLHIDEDWKTKVQAEKEALKKEAETPPPETPEEPASAHEPPPEKYPPAELLSLVQMLLTQALLTMGQMPNPMDGQTTVDLGAAKHFIDLIAVLEEKTKSDSTTREKQAISSVLHELRMKFIEVQRSQKSSS